MARSKAAASFNVYDFPPTAEPRGRGAPRRSRKSAPSQQNTLSRHLHTALASARTLFCLVLLGLMLPVLVAVLILAAVTDAIFSALAFWRWQLWGDLRPILQRWMPASKPKRGRPRGAKDKKPRKRRGSRATVARVHH
ncbi:MAG: hypothetical protein ACM31O_01535 [Bacteroidota bacterium]